jgi:hypothetical protein
MGPLKTALPESPALFRARPGEAVAVTYSRELVRLSTLIHSRASLAVREFARAFRFTKEKESGEDRFTCAWALFLLACHPAAGCYQRVRQNLLLWSGLRFLGLALSNVFIFLDRVVVPELGKATAESIWCGFSHLS